MHGQSLNGDEMIKIKGMRDIQTLRRVGHNVATGTRAQAVRELAYLELSKDQLERELEIWAGNRKRAENRLQSVRERIALLQGSVMGETKPSAKRHAASPDQGAGDDNQEAETPWREVTLEY